MSGREAVEIHTRILRCMLAAEDCYEEVIFQEETRSPVSYQLAPTA